MPPKPLKRSSKVASDQIIVTGVSSEFDAARTDVVRDLISKRLNVLDQKVFPRTLKPRTTLDLLHQHVSQSRALICIIGERSGETPPKEAMKKYLHMLPQGWNTATYTQWEFFFARYHRLRIGAFLSKRGYKPDQEEVSSHENPSQQEKFIRHLKDVDGIDRQYFSSNDELCRLVLRVDWLDFRRLGTQVPNVRRNTARSFDHWTASPKHSHDPALDKYAKSVTDSIETMRVRSITETDRTVRQRIMNMMGSLTERFNATSSWLFLAEIDDHSKSDFIKPGTTINLAFSHNTGFASLKRNASRYGNGIVGLVGATGRPYLTNDTNSDRHFIKCVEAGSELAVPIVVSDALGAQHVIGILNLEAKQVNAFHTAFVGELAAAAMSLGPEILIHQHVQRFKTSGFGWHPRTFGWTPEQLLNEFCAAVSGTAETSFIASNFDLPRPSCTIWYKNREEKKLYVRGTARFDYEYINAGNGSEGFIGQVAEMPPGTVAFGEPNRLPGFKRVRKCERMGMKYAFASPIYVQNGNAKQESVGTLALYFFDEELSEAARNDVGRLRNLFPDWLLESLSTSVGTLLQNIQSLRIEVASAHLRARLGEQSLPDVTDADIARDTIAECIDADYLSMFARYDGDRSQVNLPEGVSAGPAHLRCITTTGLKRFDGESVDCRDVVYRLDEASDKGVTTFLAAENNRTLMRSSVVEMVSKQGTKKQPVPVNKYRETHSQGDTEHRPFLGIGVTDTDRSSKHPVGVIRVLRRARSRPFVHFDKTLLRRLSQECLPLFHHRFELDRAESMDEALVCAARHPFSLRVIGTPVSREKLSAINRLGAATQARLVWNRRQIDATLLDLMQVFRNSSRATTSHGALIANLRMSMIGEKERLKIYAVHAIGSSDPPDEEEVASHESSTTSVGLTALSGRCPVTFRAESRLFRPVRSESKFVVSGACMPIRTISWHGVSWGILSIDTDNMEFDEWRTEHLEIMALAAKKLDIIGRDNCFAGHSNSRFDSWKEAARAFLGNDLPEVGVLCPNIMLDHKDGEMKPLVKAKRSHDAPTDCASSPVWIEMEGAKDIRWTADGHFLMDLWYGAFRTRLKLVGKIQRPEWVLSDSDYTQHMSIKMADVTHLWNRFVCTRVGPGTKPLFHLTFKDSPELEADGIRLWKEEIRLGVNLFGRTPINL